MMTNDFKQRYRATRNPIKMRKTGTKQNDQNTFGNLKEITEIFILNGKFCVVPQHARVEQQNATYVWKRSCSWRKADKGFLLNKRSKIVSKWRHKNKFYTNNISHRRKTMDIPES